jgi:hypothetical protein
MSPLIMCVHATHRAVDPARRMLSNRPGEFRHEDLVEEELLRAANDRRAAFSLLAGTLKRAEAPHPAAILTTCSIYTPLLPAARKLVSTPIVGVDEPMIERAARTGGMLALVGSLPAAIDLTALQILERAEELDVRTSIAERRKVPPDACETSEGRLRLADELRELSRGADVVVVVQLSLSPAADCLSPEERERILTSPPLALERLREMVETRGPGLRDSVVPSGAGL